MEDCHLEADLLWEDHYCHLKEEDLYNLDVLAVVLFQVVPLILVGLLIPVVYLEVLGWAVSQVYLQPYFNCVCLNFLILMLLLILRPRRCSLKCYHTNKC